ncbi:protein SOSEKI 3-like isoform X1 [Musa acuminata AAA Group]|uniref:protein SOSEKI 3-like isoform X1 n=1 Tax=Musa acuminata AAA Group TaxID=214697 RepID=UPI0031DB05F4
MRRYARAISPERTKVWAEPPPKHHHSHSQQQGRKVPVVYYLCRNRHLDQPHSIEVPLCSPEGLYLRDVVDRLNVQRGKGMAAMYSWSCKRSYKNGFVWQDLSEDDLILPVQGTEYVLKGSELLDRTPPDRDNHSVSNVKTQNPKHRPQETPICYKGQEASCSSSSKAVVINEAKLPTPSPIQPPPPSIQEDELSPSTRGSGSSKNFSAEPGGRTGPSLVTVSPKPSDYRICKPFQAQDASTQTDNEEKRRKEGSNTRIRLPEIQHSESQNEQTMCLNQEPEIVKVESSPPPPTFASVPSSSCGKTNTLESLIREEANKRNNLRNMEAEDIFPPTGPKSKATNMLIHLITCGSISVKDRYSFGFVPTYRPRFGDNKFTSPMFANSIVLDGFDCLPESQRDIVASLTKKEVRSRSMFLTNRYTEETGEEISNLKLSSSFDEARNCNMPYWRRDKEKTVDSAQSKCLPMNIKITSCKHSRAHQNESMMSPRLDIRKSSAGPDICNSSPLNSSNGGSKRTIDSSSIKGSSMRLESFRELKDKMIKIEERLTSGARVIIESRYKCDDSEDSSD